ncbi:hypothetical protein ACJMK2_024032 [Sinanodonta woodiana]|uniref:Granulins domain-containing protein n=1 Tax=Sinanodonta woodiana TaxID=1069815 RepID=A0ABD3T7V8_SINWO
MLVLLAVYILTSSFFVNAEKPNEVHAMKQVRTYMAVNRNVDKRCGMDQLCPGTQSCCESSSGWRCCPYTNGNCCSGGMYCCPSNKRCTVDLRCI